MERVNAGESRRSVNGLNLFLACFKEFSVLLADFRTKESKRGLGSRYENKN
jgi:hypothetical protein